MTSPFTGTDELELRGKMALKNIFFFNILSVYGYAKADLIFNLFHKTKCISICLSINAYLFNE